MAPSLISSSPATMRSAVVFPHPDGPTRTMNSPSAIVSSSASTARVPSGYTFDTASSRMVATVARSALDRPAEPGAAEERTLEDQEACDRHEAGDEHRSQ